VSQTLTIGVDFGSTGLRVAWLGDVGRPEALPGRPGAPWPWILCERQPGARLGIAFPSLKSRLGAHGVTPLDGLPATPEEVVTEAFRAAKRGVEEHTSRPVAEVVVTVPALYSSAQRTALRGAVLAAGFAEAHLLNDSLAAVIAQTAQQEGSATVLVYAMGYAGFELGLIRAAHGRYRALGYEGGWSPGGWAFDRLLLESLVGFFDEQRLQLGRNGWDAARWLQIRSITEQVKEGLSTEDRVAFPVALETSEGRPLGVLSLGRAGFEEAVRPWLDQTLQQMSSLLDQAGMTSAQVDTILLVGGSTRIPLLRSLIAGTLGREPVCLDREALVRGAALFAAQLESRPLPAGAEHERAAEGAGEREIPADLAALRAALAVGNGPVPPANGERLVLVAREGTQESQTGQAILQPALRLLEQGRTAEARSLLEEVIREAQSLIARLDQPPPAASPSPAAILARRALARAQQLLKKGQYEEAVRESHLAWQQDRESPDTFEQMIDVHCQAALASNGTDGYADAQRWLMCAYTHDEGNTRVRHLIADRHFAHARQIAEQGKRKQALETLEHCIAWNPEHEGARELHSQLMRR
jgi:tetratricopeptide (TPR) repeat protein